MRKIYSSQRNENIDRVVALLNAADIATHLTNRSVYKTASYQRFSYSHRNNPEQWPAVWVVHANDQVRARAILREAGLEPATRYADDLAVIRQQGQRSPTNIAARLRLITIAVLAGVLLILILRYLGKI